MNEAHGRFHDWLTSGAEGDPPRDLAVHASVCEGCRQSIAAFDRLSGINPGLAGMPAEPTGSERGRLAPAGRLLAATAVLFSATILGMGISQLIGVQRPGGPVAHASPTPDQNVLSQTATPQPSAEVSGQETLTPLGTPIPTAQPLPGPTPIPWRTPVPTPRPTQSPTILPSPTPAPSATEVPTATPTPTTQCNDLVDNDGDGYTDLGDPGCADASDDNESPFDSHECNDGIDNDGDHLVDSDEDPACGGNPFGSEGSADLIYECNDGIDNEAVPDGLIDFGGATPDPDCASWLDNDESS